MAIKLFNIQIYRNLSGTWRMEAEIDPECVALLRRFLDRLKGRAASAELSVWRDKRSLDANAYAWVLIDKIAAEMRLTQKEVYRQAIREIGGVSDVVTMLTEAVEGYCQRWATNGDGWQAEVMSEAKTPGWTHVRAYYGSSVYDTAQMSLLIDHLIQDAKELGIETLPPAELERLTNQWRKA